MSKFLVTGGAGFIGSHIAERLVRDNHYVRILDNFSSGKLSNIKGFIDSVDLVKGDITSKSTCRKAAKGIDFILHQAGLRSVPKSMTNPHLYNETNIGGTLNMLEAARDSRVKRFVLASSSSVYGDTRDSPKKESYHPHPISPYALSKLACEHYCNIFAYHYNLPTITLRYFNVFGPRQALDDEYAVVVPKFINCILKDRPFPVYGTGKQSRDFTYVSNVVEANLLAVARTSIKSRVFNVASGKNHTVLELAGILNRLLGKNIKPLFLEKRRGDVFKTFADLSLIKRKLMYKPKVDFVTGLRLTIDYWSPNEKV